jgi:hypothetical protein
MWYRVESDKSTIRNEGEPGCKLTYKNLRELFRLPSFDTMMVGLSGEFNRLMQWSQDTLRSRSERYWKNAKGDIV